MANSNNSNESDTPTTTDQAIQNVLDDGFAAMSNGERSTTNLSIRDLIDLKKEEAKNNAAKNGRVFGRVSIRNNSARF